MNHINWEQVFQVYPDGLLVTDRDFTIRFANDAFLRVIGKEAQDVIGKKCQSVFPSALCGTTDCPLESVQNNEAPNLFNGQHHCKILKEMPWVVTATAFLDSEGHFAGLVEKISDAEILHKYQKELHHNQELMRKNMGAVIQAMSTTVEKRDPYTAGHQRRVTKLCRAIATELDFSWSRIQGLRMAAAVHDLGKILIPYAILNKPGPMLEPEMAIIRMHPQTAYDILKNIEFPWPLAETIYQHHERLDGSGYPRGLKADQILLEARILSVADVVESMTYFRPYRPSVGLREAIKEITTQKGILYDPQVVDVCILLLVEKGFDFKTKEWQRPIDVDSSRR